MALVRGSQELHDLAEFARPPDKRWFIESVPAPRAGAPLLRLQLSLLAIHPRHTSWVTQRHCTTVHMRAFREFLRDRCVFPLCPKMPIIARMILYDCDQKYTDFSVRVTILREGRVPQQTADLRT